MAAFLKDAARGDGDAVAVAHLGVLRAAYTLATGWDMATPMPADLDVSKIFAVAEGRGFLVGSGIATAYARHPEDANTVNLHGRGGWRVLFIAKTA